MKLYILLSIIGLILDLFGFIGIYLTKLKNIKHLKEYKPYYISDKLYGRTDIKTISKEIINSVNESIKEINRSHKEQDRKTLKFFGCVIIGVSLQIFALFVYTFC